MQTKVIQSHCEISKLGSRKSEPARSGRLQIQLNKYPADFQDFHEKLYYFIFPELFFFGGGAHAPLPLPPSPMPMIRQELDYQNNPVSVA